MKKKLIYSLSALTVVLVAGISFTIGSIVKEKHTIIGEKDGACKEHIIEGAVVEDSDYKSDTQKQFNNKENNKLTEQDQTIKNKPSTSEDISKNTSTYKIVENKDKGTFEIKFNNKIIVKDLKEGLGETGKYLIYAKIGENNIPDSEILDWDIAFINKQNGKVTILEDALYLEDPYVEESKFYYIIDNTFYGVIEDDKKLFKVDLTKDTINKIMIKNSPNLDYIAGFYSKADLLFVVDKNGDVLSYNDTNNEFIKQSYIVKSNGNVLHFSEIYDTDEFIKDLKFVENYNNKDGLELYVNRYEKDEDGAFFEYNQNEGKFYLMD